MNKLAAVWPNMNNASRLPRYFKALGDLPDQAFAEMVEQILDTAKTMPLPDDFRQIASRWRHQYAIKNGEPFGAIKEAEIIECLSCMDLGIVRIQHHTGNDFDELMRCDCHIGEKSDLAAPQWDNQLGGAFKKSPVPINWFKCDAGKIFEKAQGWTKKRKKAEKHWSSLGYKP